MMAVAVAVVTVVVPKFIGAVPYTVLTGSMRPALQPGTLAVVEPVDPDQVRIGDVITYQQTPGRPETVTHRVVGVNAHSDGQRTFLTQGDANTAPDPAPVRQVQVRGQVAYTVPWMGYVNSAINTHTRSTAIVVVAVVLIGYGLVLVLTGARNRYHLRRQA
ncbi:signal peptidase I [Georgenia sp. 10Sc9-8]|uniref:Signal peptidase I n=1 Tax=Georgenia halotolerans TaxID=3028317 RepID=A0ABT5TW08_9MICO|nr:signal peptidase I [Georgenia halotolerans]